MLEHLIKQAEHVPNGQGEHRTCYTLEDRGLIERSGTTWNGRPTYQITQDGRNMLAVTDD